MTIDTFCELLSSLRARGDERITLAERMVLLQGAFLENDVDAKAFALPLLKGLLGASRSDIKFIGDRHWEDSFILITDTGEWLGFSNVLFGSPVANGYENCLLVHFDSDSCDAALIVDEVWADKDDLLGCGNLIANCGAAGLGELKDIAPPHD